MLSPVVLGVKRSVATRLGWAGNAKVTWKDIAAKAKAGQLRYGMTNPAASNSGVSALVGVAAALAGTGDALRVEDTDERGLTDFFTGQTLCAGSSGWLADAFMTAQDKLDGLINYESVLLGLNASGKLREPPELIYPEDGIITATSPSRAPGQARPAGPPSATTSPASSCTTARPSTRPCAAPTSGPRPTPRPTRTPSPRSC